MQNNNAAINVTQTPEQKIKAFQAAQAAAKLAAGCAPRQRKSAMVVSSGTELLWSFDEIVANFSPDAMVLPERREFWLKKKIRQSCWDAACELFREYQGPRHLIDAAIADAEKASGAFSVDNLEIRFQGAAATQGPVAQRKNFWKFVRYERDSICPPDLLIPIDIEMAMDAETHHARGTTMTQLAHLFAEAAEQEGLYWIGTESARHVTPATKAMLDEIEKAYWDRANISPLLNVQLICARALDQREKVTALEKQISDAEVKFTNESMAKIIEGSDSAEIYTILDHLFYVRKPAAVSAAMVQMDEILTSLDYPHPIDYLTVRMIAQKAIGLAKDAEKTQAEIVKAQNMRKHAQKQKRMQKA